MLRISTQTLALKVVYRNRIFGFWVEPAQFLSHKSVPVPNRYAHFNLQLFNIVVPLSLNLTNNRMLICLKYASIPTENEYGYKGVLCFE